MARITAGKILDRIDGTGNQLTNTPKMTTRKVQELAVTADITPTPEESNIGIYLHAKEKLTYQLAKDLFDSGMMKFEEMRAMGRDTLKASVTVVEPEIQSILRTDEVVTKHRGEEFTPAEVKEALEMRFAGRFL